MVNRVPRPSHAPAAGVMAHVLALLLIVPVLSGHEAALAQAATPSERGPLLRMTQSTSTWGDYVISENGSTAAAVSVGAGMTQVSKLATGRAVAFIPAIGPTAISADGATVIVGGTRGELHVYSEHPVAPDLSSCAADLADLKSVALSADGRTSYVVDSQGKGRACDLPAGIARWNATLPWPPYRLRLSADRKRLLAVWGKAALASPRVQVGGSAVLDAATGRFISRLDTDGGNAVIDGSTNLDGSRAYTIRNTTRGVAVWAVGATRNAVGNLEQASPGRLERILARQLEVDFIAMNPARDRIAIGAPPEIHMMDAVSGKLLWSVESGPDLQYAKKLDFFDNGTKLWAGTPGRSPVILDAATGERSYPYSAMENVPAQVDFVAASDDGAIVAGWGRKHLSIWDTGKGKAIVSLGSGESTLHVAKNPLPASPYSICQPPQVVISPDGSFAFADLCDEPYLIDLRTLTYRKLFATREQKPSAIGPGAFSQNGDTLALSTSDGRGSVQLVTKGVHQPAPEVSIRSPL